MGVPIGSLFKVCEGFEANPFRTKNELKEQMQQMQQDIINIPLDICYAASYKPSSIEFKNVFKIKDAVS